VTTGTANDHPADDARLRQMATRELAGADIRQIRELLLSAFPAGHEGFVMEDWHHALGGRHFIVELDGRIVSHAAVVERALHVGGRPARTGYVEAVATAPALQGRGLGSRVMTEVAAYIRDGFELGALATGSNGFYERLGWRTWAGPSAVRTDDGLRPTRDDDGGILVLETPTSPPLDLTAPISCDWRPGDVW
jgi:aminoglycoside 2'-N-acetyltransferase I